MNRLFFAATLLTAAIGAGGCASSDGNTGAGGAGGTGTTASSTGTASTTSTSSSSSSSGAGGSGTGGTSSSSSGTGGTSSSSSGTGGSPPGDNCATAIMLPGAGTYNYDNSGLTDDYLEYMGACSSLGANAYGPDMVFAIVVPPGQILDVTQTPDPNSNAVLAISSACGDPITSCLQLSDTGLEGDPESLTYVNGTTAAETLYILADDYFPYDGGPFTLVVGLHAGVCGDGKIEGTEACDDGNAVANDGCTNCAVDTDSHCTGAPSVCVSALAGETCGNAISITGSGTFTGTYTGYYSDYDPTIDGCSDSSEGGPDIVYALPVTANQFVTATLTPGGPYQDVALYILDSCGPQAVNSCVIGTDSGFDGAPETVSYGSATAQTLYLVVDGSDPALAGSYTLEVNVLTTVCGDGVVEGAEPCDDGNSFAGDGCTNCVIDTGYHCSGSPSVCSTLGDVCSKAYEISASGTFSGSFDGFTNDYTPGGSGCTGFSEPGPDVVYTLTLAANQTLTAKLTPGDGQDVALYVVTDCANVFNTCTVGADEGVEGDPESLTYTPTTAQTVFLIVDGNPSTLAGPYTLDINLSP